MKRLLKFMRVNQWYKNLLIFLPLIFGQQLFNADALMMTLLGFISLCFVSSGNYILNDILDYERDKYSPMKHEKIMIKHNVLVVPAFILAILFVTAAIMIGTLLSLKFIYFIIALFVLTQVYSSILKHELFADILLISINFVLRAVSGAYVIVKYNNPYIWVSPWLLVCTFFLALFLAVGKRKGELAILKKKAPKYKAVLADYTPALTAVLMHTATAALIISYILYSFLSVNELIIFTSPFAVYAVFRYLYLIYTKPEIAIAPQKIYKDARMIIGIILWAASVVGVIYWL